MDIQLIIKTNALCPDCNSPLDEHYELGANWCGCKSLQNSKVDKLSFDHVSDLESFVAEHGGTSVVMS